MLLFIIVPSILCCVYAWRRRRKYLQGKLPPISNGAWPIVGHMHLWVKGLFWPRLLDMQEDCLKQGGMTYFYSGANQSYTYYAISNPNDCEKVANSCTEKVFLLEDSLQAFFGQALATKTTVPDWDKRRTLLEPMFDAAARTGVWNRHAKILVEELESKVGKGFFDQTECLQNAAMGILLTNYKETSRVPERISA
ncbi:uncharacterized protein LOC114363998 [Ostrinia furnacalis]|uniref:uncharacterized protein LOC114363998 n=1 Tax=Ostrinia furnacalis TaxID=93504 RepID=UPI00103CC9ED|nr:uncharacterized protein LOC114363998 [Ostrinia furnacalis]